MNIPALTGARFFAAAAIVLYHSQLPPFFPADAFWPLDPSGGVPFFFVLSGFVLTLHAEKYRSHLQFMIARLARIWPAYLAAVAFWFALFWPYSRMLIESSGTQVAILVANLAMVQAWVPDRIVYWSINAPSWSVSAEMFFYAVFPAVLWRMRRHGLIWLALLTLAVIAVQMAVWTLFPGVDVLWLGRYNPVIYLPAFAAGVLAGHWFKATGRSPREGTRIQWGALALMLAANMLFKVEWLGALPLPLATAIAATGAAPAYAALILALARYHGGPSRWLSRPTIVFLGEISYGLYLFHQLIIRWHTDHLAAFSGVPVWGQYAGVWIAALLISAVCYLLIERPGRRGIVALGAAAGAALAQKRSGPITGSDRP
ncbi:acyltransferase [Azorhizobium caulinodans]|uniref:acyltransferase family protein n=1 Tax=Azorhizobium caulinodans TaxID=7 RepID=UPI002FBE0FA9